MEKPELRESFLEELASRGPQRIVDEVTAADLELDEVFGRIDRSLTSPGRSMLYALLRSTPTGQEGHDYRIRRLRFWRERPELRNSVRGLLKKTGFQREGDASLLLFDFPDLGVARYRVPFRAWIALSILAYLSPLAFGVTALGFVCLPVALVNIVIYLKTNSTISLQAASIHYLGLLVAFSRRLSRLGGVEEAEEARHLLLLLPRVRKIEFPASFLKPVTSFGGDIGDSALLYLKVFLLAELDAYLRVIDVLRGKGEELRATYVGVGKMDALCALAALAKEKDAPREASVKAGSRRVAARGLLHPLVENCVPVSLEGRRGIILTGTNMSGKSTFLRTLGISQVLATNLGLAFASSFETDLFFVVSSIRSEDDRAAGKSRYFLEAERLLRIVESIRAADPPLLSLIDEILNGTNSQDRIAASIAILRGAAGKGSIVIAATHDLDLARALEDEYDLRHFSERIEGNRIVFDYELKDGIVDRKNALRLLRLIGFGEDLLGPETASSRGTIRE